MDRVACLFLLVVPVFCYSLDHRPDGFRFRVWRNLSSAGQDETATPANLFD